MNPGRVLAWLHGLMCVAAVVSWVLPLRVVQVVAQSEVPLHHHCITTGLPMACPPGQLCQCAIVVVNE